MSPPRLKVALFATASRFSLLAGHELLSHQDVVALVLPGARRVSVRETLLVAAGMRQPPQLVRTARARNIAVLAADPDQWDKIACKLRQASPDLICIATFPTLVPQEIVRIAPLGAVNLHPSLLPRHRGPLPLFWTYHADDRTAGVTVHRASPRLDAGDILAREPFPLARGYPIGRLDDDVAVRGATLLRTAVADIAAGKATAVPQDEAAATYAPRVPAGKSMTPFNEWDVERVWHFLAGLCPRYRESLQDERGKPALYDAVAGLERGHSLTPGQVQTVAGGWKLHCRGGLVLLSGQAR